MRSHPNPRPSPPPMPGQAATLVRVAPSLACVVCGYEQTRGRERVTCPNCGSTAWLTGQPAGPEAQR